MNVDDEEVADWQQQRGVILIPRAPDVRRHAF